MILAISTRRSEYKISNKNDRCCFFPSINFQNGRLSFADEMNVNVYHFVRQVLRDKYKRMRFKSVYVGQRVL
jgi:hypothetical protein